MNFESIQWLVAAGCGALLAFCYFTGLWWTVCRLPESPHPTALYFTSMVVRSGLLIAAFLLLARFYSWQSLAAVLLGFMIARLILVHRLGREPGRPDLQGEVGR